MFSYRGYKNAYFLTKTTKIKRDVPLLRLVKGTSLYVVKIIFFSNILEIWTINISNFRTTDFVDH